MLTEVDVAVVGGGFSGCAVAAHLANAAPLGFSLALFEPDELGRGAAYGTRHDEHLLNTRADAMSLFPDDPDHFVRWLGPRAMPRDFVSRRLYGTYVNEIARRALERPRFTHVEDRVRSLARSNGAYVLESAHGTRLRARAVVLATGNPPPHDGFLPREAVLHPGYVGDPWRFDFRSVGGHVLVVGSGLSALDVLVALDAAGHRGTVHVVSRHARYPQVHAEGPDYDVIPALDGHDARALVRSFRLHVETAAQRGFNWRAVVDAVRPEAEAIWRRVPPLERRRFERHLRARWERHRHRAPQAVDAVRRQYERAHRLQTHAGTLREMRRGLVTLGLRDGRTIELRPDWIVNCSGLGRAAAAKDPLLAGMLAGGLLSLTPDSLGLRARPDLTAIGAGDQATENLWIVGPPARGARFEATAVPELRLMAQQASFGLLKRANLHAGASWARGL